jgi:hypothetical protein
VRTLGGAARRSHDGTVHRAALILAVIAIPSLARADPPRRVTFGVMGGGMFIQPPGQRGRPDIVGSMVGASVRWDRPPPPQPIDRKLRVRADLAPELSLLAFGDRGAVAAGVRLQLEHGERTSHGWYDPPRFSLSIAPRVGFLAGADTPLVGVEEIFEFYGPRSAWSVGWSLGMYEWREPTPQLRAFGTSTDDPRRVGGFVAITVSR